MKLYVLPLLAIFAGTTAYAQENPVSYWKYLLENNRQDAMKEINSSHGSGNTLETLLAREIIRWENGFFESSPEFIDQFNEYENRESYLYPLWNESYFFGDYISKGFDYASIANVDKMYNSKVQNKTLRDALLYLKGIKERQMNNFSEFEKMTGQVKAIRDWQFCGVFENLGNSGIDATYPPENEAVSESGFNANSNGIVNWYSASKNSEGWMMFNNHSEYGSGVHYAQTFMTATESTEGYIRIGNSSKFKLWLNDVLIYENSKDQETDLDAYTVKVNIPKGVNRLLLKIAEEDGGGYFMVKITDQAGNWLENLSYSGNYSAYNSSVLEDLNPVSIDNEFEQYFSEKVKSNPNDFMSAYCLIKTYLRSTKYEEAREVLEPWLDEYPKSSMLRILSIIVNSYDDDDNIIEELRENIKIDDPNYHLSLLMQFTDVQELFRMSYQDMEKVLDSYANAVDSDVIKYSAELIKKIRLEDKRGMKKQLDKLMAISVEGGHLSEIKSYASLYESMLNDEEAERKLNEQINSKFFDTDVRMSLARYYDTHGSKSKTKKILQENVKLVANDAVILKNIISYLHYLEEYRESMPYIDQLLEVFPYSFVAMEMKGDALLQTGSVDEAIEWYRKSLIYNSGNSGLRTKIRDIKNEKDWVEDHRVLDVYQYIKDNKGKITENNFGYNILLDEVIVQMYKEAGGKTRAIYVYEITSESGVESLKEYNLNLYGNYSIIKSEIVKKSGKVVPAETMGSSFVFNGLEVGDIIYIDFQSNFNGYGRFYRDLIDDYQFTTYNPLMYGSYTLLAPKDLVVNHEVMNGDLEFSQSENEEFNVYKWELKDHPGIPEGEKYMPERKDVNIMLHLSTLKSWSEIANWYSDLVRQQIEINMVVKKAFGEIFPDGYESFSERERAEKIYNYMTEKLTYSYVSFKQSGFVPQKPSKTLTTKMGDCKDLSTLFLTFAEMAGMKANLVLVSTNDNGMKKLVLPSQSFNHCIAKVEIEGKWQYLELTDKNLPFMAIPNGDRNAQVLAIPRTFDAKTNYQLEYLDEPRRLKNTYTNRVKMNVSESEKKFVIETEIGGAIKTYTSQIFDNESYVIVKKKMLGRFQSNIGDNIVLDTLYNMENDRQKPSVKYTAEVTLKEKTNKIGKFNVVKIPYVISAYTANVVQEESREYPINYISYENTDEYLTVFDIFVSEGHVFTEIPENKEFTFKEHYYSRKYEKIAPNHLRLTVNARPDSSNIGVEDYPAFKEYVNKILEAKDEFVAYE